MSSEIKDVLSTLCRCVNSLVDATLTPDHLRLAKYNSSDESGVSVEVTKLRWRVIHLTNLSRERASSFVRFLSSDGDAVEDAARFELSRREGEVRRCGLPELRSEFSVDHRPVGKVEALLFDGQALRIISTVDKEDIFRAMINMN